MRLRKQQETFLLIIQKGKATRIKELRRELLTQCTHLTSEGDMGIKRSDLLRLFD